MPVNSKKNNIDSSYFLNDFYCKVTIKKIELLPQNITVLNIRESIFDLLPVLDMSFLDNGIFSEKYPFEDEDVISIELSRSNKDAVPISMEFTLQDYTINNRDGDNMNLVDINITAIMKNSGLFYPVKTRSFANKTSVDVLKSIALEIGFNPSVKISTSDSMIWRQVNQNNYGMVFETMKRAFKSEDAILTGVTRSKDFIITSLKTELKNKSSKKVIYDPFNTISDIEPIQEKKETYYFNNFDIKNISGMVNKTIGYGVKYSYFNFKDNFDKQITSDFHDLTQFSSKNKNNIGKIVRNDSSYFLNELNVHRNYYVALAQNEYYIKDFFKICLIVYMRPTDKINLFDKIDVTFPSFENNELTNQTLSGEYLVSTIVHQASKAGHYRMVLTLFRNGMNGSPYMKKSEFKVS